MQVRSCQPPPLEIFGNSQRKHWKVKSKSLKLFCASQTAPSSFSPTSTTCLVPSPMTNFCLPWQRHCTFLVWPRLSAFQRTLYWPRISSRDPFSKSLPLLSSTLWSHLPGGTAPIHIFIHAYVLPHSELWWVLCVFNPLRALFFENRNLLSHSCVCLHLVPSHMQLCIVTDSLGKT